MDRMTCASVRPVGSARDSIVRTPSRSHDALDVGLMQPGISLSDLGLVDAAAQPDLEGARTATPSSCRDGSTRKHHDQACSSSRTTAPQPEVRACHFPH